MAYDIYLSYGRRQQALAEQCADALRAEGLTVWFEGLAQTSSAAATALSTSRLLVILFSKSSNDSDQLLQEIALADREGIPVIPILIENVRPRGEMLYELGTRNWVPLHPNPASKVDDLVNTLSDLLGVVRTAEQSGEDSEEAKQLAEELGPPVNLPLFPLRASDLVWVAAITGIFMLMLSVEQWNFLDFWAEHLSVSLALVGIPVLIIRFAFRFVTANQKLSRAIPVYGLLSILSGISAYIAYDPFLDPTEVGRDHLRTLLNIARGAIVLNFAIGTISHILMRGYFIAFAFRQRLLPAR